MHTITDRAARAMERLSQLAEIGADAERGGTTRPGLSVDEQRACELVAEWCEEEGLAVSWDAAGNLIARRPGGRDGIPEVWSGSHLDTVPGGGRFDGALGVLVALEAVAVLGSTPLAAPLAVVAFRDEEGWRFGRGFFGSRAVSGRVTEDELESADADGVRVRDALDELGLEGPPVAGPLPGTFVEVHVEQGPVLERTATGHAVVSSIAGMAGYTATIHGDAGHAGTTPMAGRRDAFLAAAELAIALRDAALVIPGAVVTTGDVRIARPAANVVPGRVELAIDARAPSDDGLQALLDAVEASAAAAASPTGCSVDLDRQWISPPVRMSERVRAALADAAAAAGVAVAELPSGAGHDAGVLAAAGVDAGMLFVRSLNGGVSHRPDELSAEDDVAGAIGVLAGALATLARAW